MRKPSESEQLLPIFVDDVDKVVQLTDTFAEHPATLGAQELAATQDPPLTDIVDRLAEFVDTLPGGVAPSPVPEVRPLILVDKVDKLVEFSDQPGPRPSLSIT